MLALTNLSSVLVRKPVVTRDGGGDGEPEGDEGSLFLYAYGTLRKGSLNNNHNIYPGLTYVETCTVSGKIYDLRWFPGIVLGKSGFVGAKSLVVCDKFKVEDDEIENGDWVLYVNNRTTTRAYG